MTKNWVHWAELDICDSSLLCKKKILQGVWWLITNVMFLRRRRSPCLAYTSILAPHIFHCSEIADHWKTRARATKNLLITSSNSPLCLFLEGYSLIADFLVLLSLLIPSPHQPHGKTREVRNLYPYGKARNEEILWFSSPFCHDHQPMRKF